MGRWEASDESDVRTTKFGVFLGNTMGEGFTFVSADENRLGPGRQYLLMNERVRKRS